jgi:hypothetical protein
LQLEHTCGSIVDLTLPSFGGGVVPALTAPATQQETVTANAIDNDDPRMPAARRFLMRERLTTGPL